MLKGIRLISIMLLCFIIGGCNFNKTELKEENINLINENNELKVKIQEAREIVESYDFYNKITTENINSFVLVESKNILNSKTLYSNGVVVASIGLKYYILSDYNAIFQNGMVYYKVMDANAIVYNASISTIVDESTGLVLLEVDISGYTSVNMETISMGSKTNLVAYFSSVTQLNKVQLTDKIKTSNATYNDTSYESYYLENVTLDKGTLLINSDNQLCGIYSSKLESFVSSKLIKQVLYSTYSLVL